jgi:hypothetical protein
MNEQRQEERERLAFLARMPKVTDGEEQLYGDRAGIVRLLGGAVSNVRLAVESAARALEETRTFEGAETSPEFEEHRRHVETDFETLVALERKLGDVHRTIAGMAIEAQRDWYERHGAMTWNVPAGVSASGSARP